MSLGLEDDAPQVEINFNVDTDENGAPLSPVDQDGDESVEAAESEAIEAEAEANKAETEQEELEEAQEALESLKLVLDKAALTGGLSPIAMEMFKIAMTSITGSKALVEQVTMESALASPVQRQLEAAKLVEVSLESLETVSMEGIKDWWNKLVDGILSLFKFEAVIGKRAKGLLALATTHKGEHATSKTIPVNVKRGLKSKALAHTEYSKEEDIVAEFKKLVEFSNGVIYPESLIKELKVDKNGNYTTDVTPQYGAKVIDATLNLNWTKSNAKDVIREFGYFNTKLYEVSPPTFFTSKLACELDKVNKTAESLPVLSIDTCVNVLTDIVKLCDERDNLKKIVKKLFRVHDVVEFVGGGVYYYKPASPIGQVWMQLYSALFTAVRQRTNVLNELVNYCGMCIQDRSVDSPTSDE